MPTNTVEIAVSGTVAVTAKLNVRQGGPSRSSPVIRKQDVGGQLAVAAIAAGDAVEGNPLWFRLSDGSYAWSGACGALQETGSKLGLSLASQAFPGLAPSNYPAANIVDLYHGDAVTSFDEARVAGVLGIIHKSTTGGTGRDDQYRARRDAALSAGLLWGAYHWGTAAPADAQAANFLDWAAPDENTLVALDFEPTPGNQMTLDGAREFLGIVAQKLGRKPVIYSGSTIKDALGSTNDAYFGSHRLWLAQYGAAPEVQPSWGSYWLWQFTDGKAADPRRRKVPGIAGNDQGEVDCNYYPGTAVQLADEWAS